MFKEKDFESCDSLIKKIESIKRAPFSEEKVLFYDNKNNYIIHHLIVFLLTKGKNKKYQKIYCEALQSDVIKTNFRYTSSTLKLITKKKAEAIFELETAVKTCCLFIGDEAFKKQLIKFVKDEDKWAYFNFYLGTLNPQEQVLSLVEFVGFFKSKYLMRYLSLIKMPKKLRTNKLFILLLKRRVFYSLRESAVISNEDIIEFFIPFCDWLDNNSIDLFSKDKFSPSNIETNVRDIGIPFICFVRQIIGRLNDNEMKKLFNFFNRKLKKNYSEENEAVFNNVFFLELSNTRINNLKSINIDEYILRNFLHKNIGIGNHKKYDKLVKIFNKKSIKFSRIKVLTSISQEIKDINLVFFKNFYKEIDHDLIKEEGTIEERINILLSFLMVLLNENNNAFKDVIKSFFQKNKDIHFIEFISEIHFRALADDKIINKMNKKMSLIYNSWYEVNKKFSVITSANYNPNKFLPMAHGTLNKALINVHSNEDFIKMFSDKREIQKNMEIFIKDFDVYKFWIVSALFRCKFNYDLINSFIKTEIEQPVYDFINSDIYEIIEEIKPYYTEQRIISLLSKRINLEFLDDPDNVIKFLKEKGVFKSSLPKKPKSINDIFTSLKLKFAQYRENDVELNQNNIKFLNKKKFGFDNEYEIIIPKTHFDLVKAGIELGQCVGGGYYTKSINKEELNIILIYKNSEVKYCIEVSPNLILRESGGYKNSKVPVSVINDLRKLITFFKNKRKNTSRN